MARAGVEGAALNVLINLPSIRDAKFREEHTRKAEEISARAMELCARTQESVRKAIAGM
jgi:formiminotetrahydrofolate cyclodeaminase